MTKPIAMVFAGFFLAFFLFFSISSCKRNTECKASIKCVDSLNSALNNASIQLFAIVKTPTSSVTYTADLKANANTDGNGEVKFTFKLPAIYDIRAYYTLGAKTYSGAGLIKLEEGKTIDKIVTVR
jgi:hypothetical protein